VQYAHHDQRQDRNAPEETDEDRGAIGGGTSNIERRTLNIEAKNGWAAP